MTEAKTTQATTLATTMLANPLRGEVMLDLGQARYVLRPSYAALVAAEAELGPLFALIERAGSATLLLRELTLLFWHCLPADADRPSLEALGDMMLATGLAKLTPTLRALLEQILGGTAQ
jgi:hypothetical protein